MKQILVLLLFVQASPFLGLRIPAGSNGAATHHCHNERTEAIHPLISSLVSFFRDQNCQVIPWALTALSALRFGGIAMNFGDSRITFDDDLDFMVTGPKTKAEGLAIVSKFPAHLYEQTSLKSAPCFNHAQVQEPVTFNASEPEKLTTAFHINVLIDLPSEVTQLSNSAVSRFLKREYGRKNYSRELKQRALHASSISREEEMADACYSQLAFAVERNFTLLDLWFDPDEDLTKNVITQIPSGKMTQQVLFAGVSFDFPISDQAFATHFYSVLCSTYGRYIEDVDMSVFCDSPQFCALAFPGYGGYDTSVSSIKNTDQVFAACAAKLNAHGFRSFNSCHTSHHTLNGEVFRNTVKPKAKSEAWQTMKHLYPHLR